MAASVSGNNFRQSFVGDGVTVAFVCGAALSGAALGGALVYLGGLLIQNAGPTAYTVTSSGPAGAAVLTFSVAPAATVAVDILATG